jgi:CUG-BP- and ETR3-like factor
MSVALNQQQLALVNQHLFSIQAMSGAQLHVSPGAPGVFHLVRIPCSRE